MDIPEKPQTTLSYTKIDDQVNVSLIKYIVVLGIL
jgi:hypothetical protein